MTSWEAKAISLTHMNSHHMIMIKENIEKIWEIAVLSSRE